MRKPLLSLKALFLKSETGDQVHLIHNEKQADLEGHYSARVPGENGKEREISYTAMVPEAECAPENSLTVWSGSQSDIRLTGRTHLVEQRFRDSIEAWRQRRPIIAKVID